jgi:hypothetical protein
VKERSGTQDCHGTTRVSFTEGVGLRPASVHRRAPRQRIAGATSADRGIRVPKAARQQLSETVKYSTKWFCFISNQS